MEEDRKNSQETSGAKGPILPAYGLAEEILGKLPGADKGPEKDNQGNALKPGGGNGGSADKDLMKFVTFFLNSEEYALPIGEVQEINRVGEITRVPNAPAHVIGVINLRGRIVPVLELKQRLRLGQTKLTKESRIVVVEHGQKVLGLMVDRVSQVLNLSPEEIEDAPEEVVQVDQNYLRGVGKRDDRMIILLDLGRVIGKATTA